MRALVVGAGAVGQVLALHLARGGADVTFGVRRPEAVRPVTLWRLRPFGAAVREALPQVPALASLDGAPAFDVIFLTVPSDALEGPFLRELARGFGGATVVGLQPGLEDRRRLLALGVDESRLVRGLISLVAFHTPLSPTSRLQDEGTAYWFPPLSPWAFDGPREQVEQVVACLRRGGMSAARRPGLERELVFFTAALLVTVRALEAKGWSLTALSADPALSARASAQALAVVERQLGTKAPFGPSLVAKSALVSWGARLAPRVVPFELETYLRVHFTKVAPQSKLLLGDLVREGRSAGLPVDALEGVLAQLGA
ncbi:MAG: 2-dehydropantoate 2-reductase N-terminal domain-containing protein [Myxococcaceae bacterium]|nr:2-dehydropantoate 2-reductase N-terminal domain-containing protein [Myxococcaceae bacterium]